MKFKFIGNSMLAAMLMTGAITVNAGSGIGGGVNFSLIDWCDDASVIVEETRDEAQDRLSQSSDKAQALRVYYQGLLNAASSSESSGAKPENSLTLRAIIRGIKLAQHLGIPAIINGGRLEEGLAGVKQLDGQLSFMDWYTSHIMQVANVVDRVHYIPYRGRAYDPKISTVALESQIIKVTTDQLKALDSKFVHLKSDGSTYYTTVPTEQFFTALSYLSNEVARDLNENVFSSALECQSKRLVKIARQAQTYVDGRTGHTQDAIKLNKFLIDLRSVVKQILTRSCI